MASNLLDLDQFQRLRPVDGACGCCGGMRHPSGMARRRAFLAAGAALGFASLLPMGAQAASGNYDAMLLACIDPRFPKLTLAHMDSRTMVGKYSQFNIAGAAIGAVAPKFSSWHQTFWDNLAASIQLHNIPAVVVINHRDCGAAKIAYGDEAVANRDAETATHRAALMAFREEAAKRQPKLRVELGLMDLNGRVETFA
jgi:carbonic anhydrase